MPEVASPESTGGAGVSFEARVGAIALATLLCGDQAPGLGLPPARVRLQQRVAGAVLDDVVMNADDPRGGSRAIEYQVKRTVDLVASDPDFTDIVSRCWEAIERDDAVAEGRRLFGLASRPSIPLTDLHRLTVIAREHDEPTGFRVTVGKTSRAGVRARLTALEGVLTRLLTCSTDAPDPADVARATWSVAQALYVWPVEAESEGRDVTPLGR